ncbi:MAG: hypothetical protein LPJ98_12220 [Cyclobacteriaceae bacterium]|nr:hypothetical protein [Cyclobacteriaceae bacterium]
MNDGPYIASIDHFPIEKSMFREMDTQCLISRYRTNKELLSNLCAKLNLNKSLQMEYWQNAWIQTYTIENRIILSVLQDRTQNFNVEDIFNFSGKGGANEN